MNSSCKSSLFCQLSFIKSESNAFWVFHHFQEPLPAKCLLHTVTKEQIREQTAFLVNYWGFSQDCPVWTSCSVSCCISVFQRFPSTAIPYPLTQNLLFLPSHIFLFFIISLIRWGMPTRTFPRKITRQVNLFNLACPKVTFHWHLVDRLFGYRTPG